MGSALPPRGPVRDGRSQLASTTQPVEDLAGADASDRATALAPPWRSATVRGRLPPGLGAGSTEPFGSGVLSYYVAGSISNTAGLPMRPGAGPGLSVRNVGPTVRVLIDVADYHTAQLEAQIGGDGSVQSGAARTVSVQHAGTGFYYVTLDRPGRECSPSRRLTTLSVRLGRLLLVDHPNVISVYIWYINGTTPTVVDYPFMLHVSC
jgi:hypothetical protein